MDRINITSAQYIAVDGKIVNITAVFDGIQIGVPLDPANRHYAEILKQVADGDITIAEAG
mgnify:CR=1 FL=1|tara:strand:+ start:377 stop:556 length:180 start_codon:yes stop_codon:yes gene_type:complete